MSKTTIPPIPAELCEAVRTLRRYIMPAKDERRLAELRKLGDELTRAQREEFCKILGESTMRCSDVALWTTGPNLDEIANAQVRFLQRLAAASTFDDLKG